MLSMNVLRPLSLHSKLLIKTKYSFLRIASTVAYFKFLLHFSLVGLDVATPSILRDHTVLLLNCSSYLSRITLISMLVSFSSLF